MKTAAGIPPPPMVKAPFSDGVGVRAEDLREWTANGGWISSLVGDPAFDKHDEKGSGLMNLDERMNDAVKQTEDAFGRFDAARKRFRSEIKNETSSIESAARKIAAEFDRVARAVSEVQGILTSGQFVDAIKNAERLAAALNALQGATAANIQFVITPRQ